MRSRRFFGLSITSVLAACASTPTAAQQADVAKDKIDQALCVEQVEAGAGKAAVRAEIDACRAKVKASRDGGL